MVYKQDTQELAIVKSVHMYIRTYLSTFDWVGESNVECSGDLLEGVLLVVHHQINYRCKVEATIREAPSTGVGLDGNHLHILKSTTLKGRKSKGKAVKRKDWKDERAH